ncbi:MAG TPA: hypothetical protein VNP92_04930 [Actinophytocola sp.]|nr:hypothetical protein [Actinophytocola sp.]
MRSRPTRFPLAVTVLLLLLTSCGTTAPSEPAAVRFTEVHLPGGATPVLVTSSNDALLIGVRRDGDRVVPGLLRRGPDGAVAEIAVHPAGNYGRQAYWYSLVADGERIVAVGGKRGGAHGNVRWSAWTGSDAGIAEQPQAFSTFGGLGAGDLIDAVSTPAGPMLVGTWASEQVGLDVAVWTTDGRLWQRQPSAGTVLENTRESLKFPMAATSLGQGILVAGWGLSDGRQRAVVWRSTAGNTGWAMTPLPDPGRVGAAVAVRCSDSTCAVTGRVDGRLAVWRLTKDTWTRLPGVPRIPVADDAKPPAPVDVDGRLTQVITDGSGVTVAMAGNERWTTRPAVGPSGQVTSVTRVGHTLYVVAGERLWQTDVGSLA